MTYIESDSEERRLRRVSKDGRNLSWFETRAKGALLTMRQKEIRHGAVFLAACLFDGNPDCAV